MRRCWVCGMHACMLPALLTCTPWSTVWYLAGFGVQHRTAAAAHTQQQQGMRQSSGGVPAKTTTLGSGCVIPDNTCCGQQWTTLTGAASVTATACALFCVMQPHMCTMYPSCCCVRRVLKASRLASCTSSPVSALRRKSSGPTCRGIYTYTHRGVAHVCPGTHMMQCSLRGPKDARVCPGPYRICACTQGGGQACLEHMCTGGGRVW